MKLVIGLVGEKGSGKETFGNILQGLIPNTAIQRVHFSDILVETLDLWSFPKTRENLQTLARYMEDGFGRGTITNAVKGRVINSTADIVIIDGVRWEPDLELVRSFPKNVLVYVTADVETRYKRTKLRKEKAYEDATSREQFLKEEAAKNETLIPGIGADADFKVNNNGDLEQLKEQVEKFNKDYLSDFT